MRLAARGGFSFCSSFPRTRAPLYFGEAEHPATSNVLARKALDSRVRGNDGLGEWRRHREGDSPALPETSNSL
ncbi:hypothetical protein [Lysobacter gummosus]|uniref:hypothetical protein n=1 Tax=Lysobacter gummosus TaxID=262324 RepID=UPI0036366969